MRYVRFVCEAEEYLPCGAITMAKEMCKLGHFDAMECRRIAGIFKWFDRNLPCPPFSEKHESGEWSKNTISWYKETATEYIGRMWELVDLLKGVGIPTRIVTTKKIFEVGEIVYEDSYQVVVEVKNYSWHRCA